MQQFAVATTSPRSIAWIIRPNDWDRFEKIIKHNCAAIGGYFNVVIPLTANDELSPSYAKFLTDYDADIVVLPTGMSTDQLFSMTPTLHPFAVIPWETVPQFISITPMGYGSGMNTPAEWLSAIKDDYVVRQPLIAVANSRYPDTSRLALIACGDVEAEEPMFLSMDGQLDFSASGYRELFLQKFLKPEYDSKSVAAHLDEEENLIPPADRFQLEAVIEEKYQFPLSNCVAILDACFQLEEPTTRRSFIGWTATHKISGQVFRFNDSRRRLPPSIVILVSDALDLEEALLFWNLRASDKYVAWLPFGELEGSLDDVAKWIDSDYRGVYYAMRKEPTSGIAFSSSSDN